jgi:serine/threonine protein kinase
VRHWVITFLSISEFRSKNLAVLSEYRKTGVKRVISRITFCMLNWRFFVPLCLCVSGFHMAPIHLSSGTRLGVYEIGELLGAGGMGEVYRARDTRLRRDVAIKILSGAFTDDPDRLARFEREARILATLNHPHIGAIYGIEDAGTNSGLQIRALVLELVEGETLAERIARTAGSKSGALRPDEVLTIPL